MGLIDDGQKSVAAPLRDSHFDVTDLRVDRTGRVAVPLGMLILNAFVMIVAEHGGDRELDPLLPAVAY